MATVWRFDENCYKDPDWWGEVDSAKALENLVVLTNSNQDLILVEIGGKFLDFVQALESL